MNTTQARVLMGLLLGIAILVIAAGIGCAPLDGTANNFKKQAEMNAKLEERVKTLETKMAVMEMQNPNNANSAFIVMRDMLNKLYPPPVLKETKAQ